MTSSSEEKKIVDTINIGILTALSNVYCCLIGKVTKVNATTLNVKPVIAREVDGETKVLPELIEVPPVHLHGGTAYVAFPVKAGDYALVIITDRCYDKWYEGLEGLTPAEMRMHDLSDGFALVGVKQRLNELTIPPEFIEIMGDIQHTGNYKLIGFMDADLYKTTGLSGVSGSFISADAPPKTITVTNGIITSIV